MNVLQCTLKLRFLLKTVAQLKCTLMYICNLTKDHLTELIAKNQSEMGILPSRLCLNLIRYLQENGDRQEVKVQELFSHLVKSRTK